MAELMKPRALTYTEMMNSGRQQMVKAEHAREQELQQRVEDLQKDVDQLEQSQGGSRTDHWMRVPAMQFRVEELNPFMEWHLHTNEASLVVACESAKRIASLIGRKTRVLNEAGGFLAEVDL